MKFVALLSGGKDSCYNALECVRNGHELVCLANLYPPAETSDEADSFMYQSAAHTAIEAQAECFGKPLIRRQLSGRAVNQSLQYVPTEEDEVEDLLLLLQEVKERFPPVKGVASGAILSNYQRTRVENVCGRLGLQSLAFLWRKRQSPLLQEMVEAGIDAVLVKVASFGLEPSKHLGKSIGTLRPFFEKLHARCGFHVCGEGGEYETLTLDCPLFVRRLVLDETVIINHADDMFAPVGLLRIVKCHTEPKEDTGHNHTGTVERGIVKEDDNTTDKGLSTAKEVAPQLNLLTHVKEAPGGFLYMSGVCAPGPIPVMSSSSDNALGIAAAEQVRSCLFTARAALQTAGVSTTKDVCFVHLYLKDMGHFASVNAEYCTWFEGENPPSRSCVSVSLPAGCLVMLDLVAVRSSGRALAKEGAACTQRQALHVRSISNWAPVCIGPYCQANTLGPGNALALIAGQIGLVPASMVLPRRTRSSSSLPDSETGTCKKFSSFHGAEMTLSVRHASAVASAIGASLSRGCVFATLFISQETAHLASASQASRPASDLLAGLVEECRGLIEEGVAEEEAEALAAAAGTGNDGDDGEDSAEEGWNSDPEELEREAAKNRVAARTIPVLPMIVPTLPKNSAVELEVVCMSRKALSLLPCKNYSNGNIASEPDGKPRSLQHHEPSTSGDGSPVPIPQHLLLRRNGDARPEQSPRGHNFVTGNLSCSIATTGSTVDRICCVAECTLKLSRKRETGSETSGDESRRNLSENKGGATGPGTECAGLHRVAAAEDISVTAVSAQQLERALQIVLDELADALLAARLSWRHVASLRVYYHQQPKASRDKGASSGESRVESDTSTGTREHRKAVDGGENSTQESCVKRALYLALAGTTGERPAVTLVPVLGMSEGAQISVHATALNLDRLKTEMWVRGAA